MSNLASSCLITAVMTDLWVHTVEPIATPKPPPHLRSLYEAAASVSLSSDSTPVDYRNPMAIDFDIGLWKVCPSVKDWIHSEYASKFDTSHRMFDMGQLEIVMYLSIQFCPMFPQNWAHLLV